MFGIWLIVVGDFRRFSELLGKETNNYRMLLETIPQCYTLAFFSVLKLVDKQTVVILSNFCLVQ